MDGFRIKSKENLLEILEISEEDLKSVINDKSLGYNLYEKKKNGGIRKIYNMDKSHRIYILQNKLHDRFFQNILFPDCVYGFRKHRSYFDFLSPHISNRTPIYYLRLDICNFFDTIRSTDVEKALKYYVSEEVSDEEKTWITNIIIQISTLNGHFVQGAVTSPIISNIVFRSLDIRIEKYCQKLGVIYTRYADDMFFSSESNYIHNRRFIIAIKSIINDKNFTINHKKTLKYKGEISLNGYVIGNDIRLSRKKLHRLNDVIFKLNKKSFKGFGNNMDKMATRDLLAGYRSFLIQSSRYIHTDERLKYIENKIICIEKLINKYCM